MAICCPQGKSTSMGSPQVVTKWSPFGRQMGTKWSPIDHQVITKWKSGETFLIQNINSATSLDTNRKVGQSVSREEWSGSVSPASAYQLHMSWTRLGLCLFVFFPRDFCKTYFVCFFQSGQLLEPCQWSHHWRHEWCLSFKTFWSFFPFQIFVSCVFYGAPGSCDGWNLFCDGEIPGQGSGDFGEIKGGWLLAWEVRCRQRTRLPWASG